MRDYQRPAVRNLGSMQELTQNVYKDSGSSDYVYITGQPPIPAGTITSIS